MTSKWLLLRCFECVEVMFLSKSISRSFTKIMLCLRDMANLADIFERWYLSNCNWTQTQNHLVRKWTLNHWVLIYELNGFGFESICSHLNFRFSACFEQGVPWHLGNYRVWIYYETRTWHGKNIETDN